MDRRNVTGHDGTVHQGLFNAYTGFLIDVTCDAGRFAVVRPYEQFDRSRFTDATPTCPGCLAVVTGSTPHPADTAREIADAVLAEADGRGYPPALDGEGLERAFQRLAPAGGELRPVFERLARGVYDPQDCYRTQPLYALVREHLADRLTERALTPPPDGTPRVLVEYTRYTGGKVMAPVGPGDRLMRNGIASGHWDRSVVLGVEPGFVTVLEDGWQHPYKYERAGMRRWFYKLDRVPALIPTTAA